MDDRKLTPAAIVDEALVLLNEEGIGGLTMRRLSARLGVSAPTLYWHFKHKTALLSAVMEVLFDKCLDSVPECDTWQDWMRAFGRSIWKVQDDYPQSSILIMSTNMEPAHFAHAAQRVIAAVAPFGLADHDLVRLQSAVQALMTGWSVFAHAKYAERINTLLDVESAAFQSLDALVAGWKTGETDES